MGISIKYPLNEVKSGIYSEKKNHIEKPIDQPISDTCGRVQNRHSRGLERKKRKRSRRFIRGRQATPNCWLSPVVLHPPPLPETLSSRSRHLAPPLRSLSILLTTRKDCPLPTLLPFRFPLDFPCTLCFLPDELLDPFRLARFSVVIFRFSEEFRNEPMLRCARCACYYLMDFGWFGGALGSDGNHFCSCPVQQR